MTRLSSPLSELEAHYDVIVIGSGYGGSITACRMARAGKKVCLLERGRELQPGEYPDKALAAAEETQLDTADVHIGKKTGLFDVRVNAEVNVVLGCGLGGGSLINANVGMRPTDDMLDDPYWPLALREDRSTLNEAYKKVEKMLKPATYPATWPMPAKSASFKKAAEDMGMPEKWKYTPVYVNFDINGPNDAGVEQKPCVGCGDCCSGCNYSAKNTLIMNYLPDAKNNGAKIFTQVNVRYVAPSDGQWKVYYNLLLTGEEAYDAPTAAITAEVVVLAAGTLGSTELLLRSASEGLSCSTMLGQHFSSNGDFLAFAYNNDLRANAVGNGTRPATPEDPVGPGISSIIDLRSAVSPLPKMVIEDGSVPGMMAGLFAGLITTASALEGKDTGKGFADIVKKEERAAISLLEGPYHGAINHTLTYLVMTDDNDRGTMLLEKDKLRIDWPGAGQLPVYDEVNKRLLQATDTLDGVYTRSPIWTPLFRKELVTVHPLGGCIMGDNAALGVVNHKGQVFTGAEDGGVYAGLYVSDGAIVPRPLCINPSLTISALAERNCIYMLKDMRWD